MSKKVALLGDSIRLFGYGPIVPQLLGDEIEVFQPEENCKFAKQTLRGLFDWREQLKDCDVIHWNCGHWDVCDIIGDGVLFSTDEEYVENIVRIAKGLKKLAKKVIFATTTPVKPIYEYNRNSDIERFNSLVKPRLEELNVEINDLYALVSEDIDGNLCDDCIHLSEQGSIVCAQQIAKVIKASIN
jgi:lysophospholipase L1-like esterase